MKLVKRITAKELREMPRQHLESLTIMIRAKCWNLLGVKEAEWFGWDFFGNLCFWKEG